MSYVGPSGGQRPDPSRYYSPQPQGGAPPPSYTPSFNPTPAAYMSPTVHPTAAQYQSPPPPTNPAQLVRQPSFVPDNKAAAKGPAVDFSFDPRAGSAVPPHMMATASRSSSGSGFPAPPQHSPSFASPYPQQVVNPGQYGSAPSQNAATLVRQPSVVSQTPSYPAAVRGSVGSGTVPATLASPSAIPLPQVMGQPAGSAAYATAPASQQPAQFAPGQPQGFGGHQQPPSPVASTFSPISPAIVGAPTSPAPAFAAPVGPSADVQRQIAETTERARQAEENAVRLKAQLDESHKQFQELVSKQSKLELGSQLQLQTFTEQQRKAEEEIKQLSERLRAAEEKNATLERHTADISPQLNALNEKATASEKRALSAEERLKAGEDKLRQTEERARKAEEQALLLSSTASQGSSTLAQQMAMREALERVYRLQAALKEANARLSNADGIWQSQNQRIATLEAELQQWRHQGPAKDLELQAALTREKSLKEALEVARKQAADSQALVGNRTQEAVLQLDQRNAELAAAHQREAELKRLLEQRGPDSGSSAKTVELQAKLDAKTAELATAAKREQAFREALEKAKKNLTDADSARMALEEDLAKAEENVAFFRAMAKTNEEMAAVAEAKLEKAIAVSMGQPFAQAEAPTANSVLDGIRARIAALSTTDSTTEALAELDGL